MTFAARYDSCVVGSHSLLIPAILAAFFHGWAYASYQWRHSHSSLVARREAMDTHMWGFLIRGLWVRDVLETWEASKALVVSCLVVLNLYVMACFVQPQVVATALVASVATLCTLFVTPNPNARIMAVICLASVLWGTTVGLVLVSLDPASNIPEGLWATLLTMSTLDMLAYIAFPVFVYAFAHGHGKRSNIVLVASLRSLLDFVHVTLFIVTMGMFTFQPSPSN